MKNCGESYEFLAQFCWEQKRVSIGDKLKVFISQPCIREFLKGRPDFFNNPWGGPQIFHFLDGSLQQKLPANSSCDRESRVQAHVIANLVEEPINQLIEGVVRWVQDDLLFPGFGLKTLVDVAERFHEYF